MICGGCQNPNAYQTHGYIEGDQLVECCDQCGNLSSSQAAIPDVFWNGRPYYSQALDVEFTSRSQKAQILKERGLCELGSQKLGEKNWIDGSRAFRKKQFEKDRPMIRETYRRYLENARRK